MEKVMKENGVDIRINCGVDKINVGTKGVESVEVNGRTIKTDAVVSNANLRSTIFKMVGEDKFDSKFMDAAKEVRLNNSSTQVYMAMHPDDTVPRETGDLLFSSTAERFQTDLLLSRDITSRTFSFYYPDTRPETKERTLIVSSTNANYSDWAELSKEDYEASKQDLVDTTLDALCLLYTSPSPRDQRGSRMPSSA